MAEQNSISVAFLKYARNGWQGAKEERYFFCSLSGGGRCALAAFTYLDSPLLRLPHWGAVAGPTRGISQELCPQLRSAENVTQLGRWFCTEAEAQAAGCRRSKL
jgi:hypothetical protein